MRGFQGVYNLERRIYDPTVRGLTPVKSPLPVKFPLPDSRDSFSLKPGSLVSIFSSLNVSEVKKPETLYGSYSWCTRCSYPILKATSKLDLNCRRFVQMEDALVKCSWT